MFSTFSINCKLRVNLCYFQNKNLSKSVENQKKRSKFNFDDTIIPNIRVRKCRKYIQVKKVHKIAQTVLKNNSKLLESLYNY